MSSSSNEDIPVELSQEIREQRIIRRFDFGIEPYGPQRGYYKSVRYYENWPKIKLFKTCMSN